MLLMMAFIGCDDKEKDDDESLGGQLSETTWAAEVKKYPFLTNFPEYDGELENHRYDDTYGILQYIINQILRQTDSCRIRGRRRLWDL